VTVSTPCRSRSATTEPVLDPGMVRTRYDLGGIGAGPIGPPLDSDPLAALSRMRLPYLRKAAPEGPGHRMRATLDRAEVVKVLLIEEIRAGRGHSPDAPQVRGRARDGVRSLRVRGRDLTPPDHILASSTWLPRGQSTAPAGP